jgi:DNA-binding transcriptional LysR family regulator
VTPHDLVEHRVLTTPPPSYIHTSITRWFAEAGAEIRRVSTCKSLPILAHLAACGCGVAVLPSAIVADELADDRLRLLPADPPLRPLEMFAAHQNAEANPGIRVVIDLARDVLATSRLLRN